MVGINSKKTREREVGSGNFRFSKEEPKQAKRRENIN
jgi:hypothetical protein